MLDTADWHRISLFLRSMVRTTAPLLSPAPTSRLHALTFSSSSPAPCVRILQEAPPTIARLAELVVPRAFRSVTIFTDLNPRSQTLPT